MAKKKIKFTTKYFLISLTVPDDSGIPKKLTANMLMTHLDALTGVNSSVVVEGDIVHTPQFVSKGKKNGNRKSH